MTQPTYAGRSLDEIKAAAEGMNGWNYNEARRVGDDEICEFGTELDGEWYPIGTVDAQTYTNEPADDVLVARHILTTNPATVLAMVARIEELDRETERLDFVLKNSAFLCETVTNGSKAYQLWTQDEDEEYFALSGVGIWSSSSRDAIDAAMEQTENREGA